MPDLDKLGVFYLGRKRDVAGDATLREPVLYDSQDLTTHAVCVGMTGSGKTGLCLALLEEAALDGIPAIAVDPKGDLGNLLLTFPELRGSDFRPWVDETVATREGITPEALADKTATMWREGLAKWDEDGARIRKFADSVDRTIYTPGSSAGVPLTILKSFAAPPKAVLEDADALGDRVSGAASGLLALVGVNADPAQSREHILLSRILYDAWHAGQDLDLGQLIRTINAPPFTMVGAVPLETFYSAAERMALATKLNNLLASPSFASWMEGEPLDVQKLFYTDEGKPRLSILSIAHLDEAERMFFVTILLNELLAWVRSQPGTSSLRAIFYMDEVFGFFPPSANPPAKRPMLTLLKQARAYGLGCVLATQNPVDLDYKGLSNAGTWFLGRLQTERDKQRVIEGLEGASAQAEASIDRGDLEKTLAGLGKRVFLLNNVHESAPTVFESRWALSYLAGPLTRGQIGKLMEERKRGAASATEPARAPAAAAPKPSGAGRPILSSDITERFWPLEGAATAQPAGTAILYRPAVVGIGRLHYVESSDDVDVWRDFVAVQSVGDHLPRPMWGSAEIRDKAPPLSDEPATDATFAPLAPELAQAKSYRGWHGDLGDRLYQSERLVRCRCQPLDERSKPEETEADFRIRCTQLAREKRDAEKERVRQKFAGRIKRQVEVVAKAQARVDTEKSRFWWRLLDMVMRVVEVALAAFSGRRSRKQLWTSTSASQTMGARQRGSQAQQALDRAEADLESFKGEQQNALDELEVDYQPANLKFDKTEIPPRKSDIAVDQVFLAWMPS